MLANSPEEMQSLLDQWQKKVTEAKEKASVIKNSSYECIYLENRCLCSGYRTPQGCCKKEEEKIWVV